MDPKNQPVTQPGAQPGRGARNLEDLQAELAALPASVTGEIVGGRLHVHPRPSPEHANAAGRLFTDLRNAFHDGITGPGGWIILHEVDLHLGKDPANHPVAPDISGWTKDRFPYADVGKKNYFTVAPNWVCEVLSPSTKKFDQTDKLNLYATSGIAHCWYADPIAKTLDVYTLEGAAYGRPTTFRNNETVIAPPFTEHAFKLNVLWTLPAFQPTHETILIPPYAGKNGVSLTVQTAAIIATATPNDFAADPDVRNAITEFNARLRQALSTAELFAIVNNHDPGAPGLELLAALQDDGTLAEVTKTIQDAAKLEREGKKLIDRQQDQVQDQTRNNGPSR